MSSLSVLVEAETVVEAFLENVRRMPDRTAMRYRDGEAWRRVSWADYGIGVAEVAAGLAELGVEPGQHVAVLGNNRVEWHLADVGALCSGCPTVPIYQTSSQEQVAYVIGQSESVVCFVENAEMLARVVKVRDQLPHLRRVVVFEGDGHDIDDPFVLELSELRQVGATRLQREPDLLSRRANGVTPDQLATIVYTSGTTGPPKGTMITHGNVMWTLRSATQLLKIRPDERLLSFLPLSHIAERMISELGAIAFGAETWFARSMATVAEDLKDCRPTVFFAVPRVWEKIHEAVTGRLGHETAVKRMLLGGFIGLGERVRASDSAGHVPIWERLPYDALDAAVGVRLRHELGLDRAHLLISAAAPIHPELLQWFQAVGLTILELYGQTETCGPTTCNPPDDVRIGTVGPAIPGDRVRIADDGEILVKGGNVCHGYYRNKSATGELIDEAGWMHSGDVGVLDDDGYLRITGRKKDLIITAAGQNIAPQDIEMDLRSHELIAEAVVVGEKRKYLTAVISLDADALAEWAEANGKAARFETLTDDPDLRAEVDRIVEVVNQRRSRVEQIRRYRILPRSFTVAGGELTPTLKVKRNVVYDEFHELIEEMYAESA